MATQNGLKGPDVGPHFTYPTMKDLIYNILSIQYTLILEPIVLIMDFL